MITTLADAPNSSTGLYDLAAEGERTGLIVRRIPLDGDGTVDVAALVTVAGPGVAYRCAGGPLGTAIATGAPIRLVGATAKWFAGLPAEVTGRSWTLGRVADARALLTRGPAFVKLAEAKFRGLPARRYRSLEDFDTVLAGVHAAPGLPLLATSGWLPIDSEYRVFTKGRDALAWSPYLVQDDPWTPLLRTHRASFHDQAAQFVSDLLAALPLDDVPPTAVLDVARLTDNRFVLLETNHVWASGLYGCDPRAVLPAVLAAADPAANPAGSSDWDRWVWRPDADTAALHRAAPRQ